MSVENDVSLYQEVDDNYKVLIVDTEYFYESDIVVKNGKCLNCNIIVDVTYTLELEDIEIIEGKDKYQEQDTIISNKQHSKLVNIDNRQLNKIDSIIIKLLQMLDKKPVLVGLTTLQQVRAVDQLIAKKVQLKESTNPTANTNQVIINFINSRSFMNELKDKQSVKNKDIMVKAIE